MPVVPETPDLARAGTRLDRRHPALEEQVGVVGDRHGDAPAGADPAGSASTGLAQHDRGAGSTAADCSARAVGAAGHAGKLRAEGVAQQAVISRPADDRRVAGPSGSILSLRRSTLQRGVVLDEGRDRLADDVADRNTARKRDGEQDRGDAVGLEAGLGAIARAQARQGGLGRWTFDGSSGVAAPGSATSVILFSIPLDHLQRDHVEDERDEEEDEARARRPTASWRCRTPGRRPAACSICTVTVVTASSGLKVRLAARPAAMTTIIVSPMARLMASMKAETMPGSAAGSTTLRMVSDLVAPIARSRRAATAARH